MTVETVAVAGRRPFAGRLWGGVVAAWGGFTGVLPHLLHHVGPLAGAALLAGAGGALLFGAIGFVAAIPFLLRLRRRFRSWKAPAAALAVFVAMFTLSTLVVGPAIAGGERQEPLRSDRAGDHASHHP